MAPGSKFADNKVPEGIMESFQKGDIRLECTLGCAFRWGSNRREIKGLYNDGLWRELAMRVIKIGHQSELSYFYLGRAAEEMGYLTAAENYYKLSITSLKCAGFLNVCNGIDLPRSLSDNEIGDLTFLERPLRGC